MKSRSLFQKRLLAWYRESHRPLPWRSTRDPYAIWISEILLQQTRVTTGVSYYERFLERFPTLSDLAEAPIEAILQVWQGLGYYGRARNLHRAARILKEEFQGEIPPEPEVLERLPGIGPYTAAAIASIAYDKDVAVLDGNVTRVLCRAYGIEDDPKHPSTRRALQGLADRLLPKGNAADFNQAVMELGALVCKPARPECAACPLKGVCVAHAKNMTARLPLRSPKARIPKRVRVVAAIEVRGRLLFKHRDPEGLLGGLWELPGVYLEGREGNKEGCRRIRKQVGSLVTLQRIPERSHFSVKHVYSHFEESIRVFVCKGKGVSNERQTPKAEQTYRWIHPNRLDPYPLTGATRKVLRGLEQRKTEQRG
jgi:A/G-specific adenine glycosylase